MSPSSADPTGRESRVLDEPTTEMMSLADALDQVRFLMLSERSDEAETEIRKILGHAPDDPTALSVFGLLQFHRRRQAEALAAFRKVVELAPEQPGGWLNLGNILIECRQFEEAAAAHHYLQDRRNCGKVLLRAGDEGTPSSS